MTISAPVLDLGLLSGMVHVFPANAGLPIRITGRVPHDAGAPVEANRNILPACGSQLVVTREATIRRVERRLDLGVLVSAPHVRRNGETGECHNPAVNRFAHYQPFTRLPSAQSQST